MKSIFLLSFVLCMGLYDCHGDYAVIDGDYRYISQSIALSKGKTKDGGEKIVHLIPRNVVDYDFDNVYIVVYQIPEEDDDIREYMRKYISDAKRDSIDRKFALMDSIKNCYWIIRKKDAKVYGPMNKHAYRKKCKELKIDLEIGE